MREPTLRTSRLAIAGGIVAVLAVGGAGFYLGRSTAPERAQAASPPQVSPAPSPTPDPLRPLGRAEIVDIAAKASAALPDGSIPEEVRAAVDRRFELAIPFGCSGPSEGSRASLRWRYDEANEALRVHVAPVAWSAEDWGIGNGARIEAIEGFWVTRPWSIADTCPRHGGAAMATGIEPVTLPGQTLAVAQFFTGDDRRGARRDGRPFEAVKRVPRAEFAAPRGFRLVVSGRIDRVPGGGPVRCIQPAGIEGRPVCVVAVTLDEVRIENPASREVIASWPVGSG